MTHKQESKKEFGARLRLLRERAGLSPYGLSSDVLLLGVDLSPARLVSVEEGETDLYRTTMVALCLALRISADELLGLSPVVQ